MTSIRRQLGGQSSSAPLIDRVFHRMTQGNPLAIAAVITGYGVVTANVIAFAIATAATRWFHWFQLDDAALYLLVPLLATLTTLATGVIAYPVIAYCALLVRTLNRARRDLRVAVAQADEANASRSRFLANTSHEIRTPLNGVLGLAQVLLASPLSQPQREHLELLHDSGQALAGILNDVLDLSKIDAGHMAITYEPADLATALGRICALWRAETDKKGISLMLDISPRLPPFVLIDLGRVRQCVGNLVANAVKFTQKGRVSVEVGVESLPDGRLDLTIEVSDTGPGIPPEKLGQLFRPFVQVDDSAARRQRGTGLGLAITRQLAQLMGGDVRAISAPGLGSRFILSLPTQPVAPIPDPVAGDEGAPAAAAAGRHAILVVDDNAVNRMVVQHFLAADGHRVVQAVDGQNALEMLEQHVIDLVLLDIHMPGLDGPDTLAAIRRADRPWADLPAIALTADAMSGDRERYIAMGMADYVSKPIDQTLLRRVVRAVLAGRPPRGG